MRVCPNCDLRTEEITCPECNIRTLDVSKFIEQKRDPDKLIGKLLLHRYQITKLIGIGGMGNVYEAHHTVFDKRFAVKVIKKSLVDNLDAVKRFQREAFLASKLDHPNVVKVYDFGELDSGQQFILMEYIQGESLRTIMKQAGQMQPFRVAAIGLQIAKALDYAHTKGVIHRDIKPDNIFIRTIRGEDFVKVLDFGVAKLLNTDEEGLTKEGLIPGTPEYMSPEQVLGKDSVGERSDIYSFGLVLYEMLTNSRPFRMETPMASAVAHLKAPAPPLPDEVASRLPRDMVNLLQSMTERNWRKRPETAEEVANRIKSLKFRSNIADPRGRGEVTEIKSVLTPAATSRIQSLGAHGVIDDLEIEDVVTMVDRPPLTKTEEKSGVRLWVLILAIFVAVIAVTVLVIQNTRKSSATADKSLMAPAVKSPVAKGSVSLIRQAVMPEISTKRKRLESIKPARESTRKTRKKIAKLGKNNFPRVKKVVVKKHGKKSVHKKKKKDRIRLKMW